MAKRHIYLRDFTTSNRRPVGCLVVELHRDMNEIRYAFSTCSPKDTFDAVVAQNIAHGRLTKHPNIISGEIPRLGHEITKCVMQHIIANNKEQGSNKPARSYLALQAAQGWLEYIAQKFVVTTLNNN